MEQWAQLIVAVLSGLATAIPLVIKLAQYISKAVKEKNWDKIVSLTIDYMMTAETMFTDGATKKVWVLEMVKSSASSINYDLDDVALANISALIDSFCDAARIINGEANAAVADV